MRPCPQSRPPAPARPIKPRLALLLGAAVLALACNRAPTPAPDDPEQPATIFPLPSATTPTDDSKWLQAGLPVPATDTAIEFVAFGDTGSGLPPQFEVAASLLRHCQTRRCDLVTHVGDLIYPAGIAHAADPLIEERVNRPYRGLVAPFFVALGNHETYGSVDALIAWSSRLRIAGLVGEVPAVDLRLPARWYTFVAGPVRFLALDSNLPSEDQARWAERVLADSVKAGTPWVIAFSHHPRRSYGPHGDATADLAAWYDRVLCGRVDLLISGHDHDQQLLKPRCGVHQLVTGGGGASLRPSVKGEATVWARSMHGFAHLRVDLSGIDVTIHGSNGGAAYTSHLDRAR